MIKIVYLVAVHERPFKAHDLWQVGPCVESVKISIIDKEKSRVKSWEKNLIQDLSRHSRS
jgi:hypothetical protein